uniref:Uncharacterized protein n=1 Tax=Romanomermis culicivorax TaxID=13658 RepID=A0A915JM14_ROMCU
MISKEMQLRQRDIYANLTAQNSVQTRNFLYRIENSSQIEASFPLTAFTDHVKFVDGGAARGSGPNISRRMD